MLAWKSWWHCIRLWNDKVMGTCSMLHTGPRRESSPLSGAPAPRGPRKAPMRLEPPRRAFVGSASRAPAAALWPWLRAPAMRCLDYTDVWLFCIKKEDVSISMPYNASDTSCNNLYSDIFQCILWQVLVYFFFFFYQIVLIQRGVPNHKPL